MNTCALGAPIHRNPSQYGKDTCRCGMSCEPHLHVGDEITCLHDGTTDHAHCPNGGGDWLHPGDEGYPYDEVSP